VQIDASDKELFVHANELLTDVFENILINAAKYNSNSTIDIFIKITKVKEKGGIFIKIEFMDNGIGVLDVSKESIFQKGYKKDKNVRGLGIGLSLVKNIINSFKGKIWVEDRISRDYSKGSNFITLIPKSA
jgi:signal transduction histidine kinase